MEQQQDKKEIESFNITSLWHKSIYDSLQRTEQLEKICRFGGVDVEDSLQQNPQDISTIKFQHLSALVTELRILFDNSKAKLDKLFYLVSKIQLSNIQDDINMDSGKFMFVAINDVTKEDTPSLTQEFYICLNTLSRIRAGLVSKLSDTLFGEIKTKEIGMDKNKTGEGLIR